MAERKSKLYKLVNRIGTYWVIAKDPTDAETKLALLLNNADYGTTETRIVREIHFIADEVGDGSFGVSGKFLVI